MKKIILIIATLIFSSCSQKIEPIKLDTKEENCRLQCIEEYKLSEDKVSFDFEKCFNQCNYFIEKK